jgi:hypothetical protein
LDWNRVEVEQRIYEPERDAFTFDSPEMRILYRILDWHEKNHADVFFQQMWCNVPWLAYPEFRDDPVGVSTCPVDLTFADGFDADGAPDQETGYPASSGLHHQCSGANFRGRPPNKPPQGGLAAA